MADDFWDSDHDGIDDFVEFMMIQNAMEEDKKNKDEDDFDPEDDYDWCL